MQSLFFFVYFDQVKHWIFDKIHFDRTRDGLRCKSHEYKVCSPSQDTHLV